MKATLFVTLLVTILALVFVRAEDDLMMMLDAGANPSLCNCACECQRPKGADLLKEKNSDFIAQALPIKVDPVA
jgi:hypothetical protein